MWGLCSELPRFCIVFIENLILYDFNCVMPPQVAVWSKPCSDVNIQNENFILQRYPENVQRQTNCCWIKMLGSCVLNCFSLVLWISWILHSKSLHSFCMSYLYPVILIWLLFNSFFKNERLKHINKELEEKAESSELQINAISREYRVVLESKEVRIHIAWEIHWLHNASWLYFCE